MNIQTPAARATDPDPSHAAADEVTRNGRRHANRVTVAKVVADHPGYTSRELAYHCTLERHEVARRLSECETAGDVIRGEARQCRIGGRSVTTWWPVSAA